MTKTGKITRDDFISAIIGYYIPDEKDVRDPYRGESFRDIVLNALHYEHVDKGTLFGFAKDLGLLPALREKQLDVIATENIKRDMEKRPRIKFYPSPDFRDMRY